MKGIKRLFIIAVLLTSVFSSSGQNLYKIYGDAEKLFYEENFGEALTVYQSIAEVDTSYEDIHYKMEICKLLSDRQYTNMDIFFEYETEMAPKDKFYYYWRGRILLEEYQFEEAQVFLKRFRDSPDKKSDEILVEAQRWIEWSIAAQKFMDNPEYYEIHLLEEGINTSVAELSPVYFSEKEELLFLSNRDPNNPDEFKIYHTAHEGSRSWTEPQPVANVGTFTRDNSNIEVVAEDGRLFQFRTDKGGDLFFSEPTDTKNGWSEPKEFDSKISSTHLSSHFFINEHEDRIIFAKDVGKKNKPNLDLFQSYRDHETGKWTKPALFSTDINSEFNEDSPYLSPDEKTLYFASDGHETMGGYDIFKSTFDEKTQSWSKPINLGFPVNSPDDEIHFKLNPDQMSGYFTSNRLNTYGDYDIFFFWEIHTVKIKGRVIDGPTGEPITNARIFFRPIEYTDMYFFSPINNEGRYETEITADDVFKVEVKMPDNKVIKIEDFEIHATGGANTTYIKDFYVGEINPQAIAKIPQVTTTKPQVQPKNPTRISPNPKNETKIEDLGKMSSINSRAIVRNIYFDFGNTKVTNESLPVLNKLLDLMNQYPKLRIEIGGHTDSVGEVEVNQQISELRANAVKNWLINKGVDASRIVAKGYGETQPMATNDDEYEGRELNRRIEITVL